MESSSDPKDRIKQLVKSAVQTKLTSIGLKSEKTNVKRKEKGIKNK